jgi:hypothetical protein
MIVGSVNVKLVRIRVMSDKCSMPTFLKSSFLLQPLPPRQLLIRHNPPYLFLACFPPPFHARWIWTPYPVHLALSDTQLPKVLQASAAEDVLAGQENAFSALDRGQAYRTGI